MNVFRWGGLSQKPSASPTVRIHSMGCWTHSFHRPSRMARVTTLSNVFDTTEMQLSASTVGEPRILQQLEGSWDRIRENRGDWLWGLWMGRVWTERTRAGLFGGPPAPAQLIPLRKHSFSYLLFLTSLPPQ